MNRNVSLQLNGSGVLLWKHLFSWQTALRSRVLLPERGRNSRAHIVNLSLRKRDAMQRALQFPSATINKVRNTPLDRSYIVVGWLADIRYERHDAGLVVGIAYTLYRENLAQKQLYRSLVSIQSSSLCIVAKLALLYKLPNAFPALYSTRTRW